MSDNVVHIADLRRRRMEIPPAWIFDLRAYVGVDGYSGSIISYDEEFVAFPDRGLADRLRRYADCLDQLSWYLRQQAERHDPSDDGTVIATATIFQSSKVRVRVNDDEVTTEEQMLWLDSRFDDAKIAARPPETPT